MAKYRLLSNKELVELEKEFIDFLILNSIVASDWANIKNEDPAKAERIIHLFSDVVFEKIMRKSQFLEWRGESGLKALQCLKDKYIVVGLDASKIAGANLKEEKYMKMAIENPPQNLEVYTTEIPYTSSREVEMFELIEKGFQISDGKLFKTLCLVLPQ
jgi:hypothetical protein